jgi:hypothetical protein
MKHRKIGLIVLLILGTFKFAYSDGGCCIEFTARLTLNNDSIITGYFFSTCGEFNIDSISMNEIVSRKLLPYYYYDNDSIRIFTDVIRLKNIDNYGEILMTCYPESVTKIALDDILKIKQLDKKSCHPELNNRFKYESNGLYPFVIQEFSRDEIDLMMNKKPVMSFHYYDCFCWDLSYFFVISYNQAFIETEIHDIISDSLCQYFSKKSGITDYENCQKEYLVLKEKLRDKNIIIFKYNYDN